VHQIVKELDTVRARAHGGLGFTNEQVPPEIETPLPNFAAIGA
jgi:hypothetical protein